MTKQPTAEDLLKDREILTKQGPSHRASKCCCCDTNAINWHGWICFSFYHFEDVALCPKCAEEHLDFVEHLTKLQDAGL